MINYNYIIRNITNYTNYFNYLAVRDIHVNVNLAYYTPCFSRRMLCGFGLISELLAQSYYPKYFYTSYLYSQNITLYKSLFNWKKNHFYFGLFTGLINEYLSLNSKDFFFEKSYVIKPACTFILGIASQINFVPITIQKKPKKYSILNAGKLMISIENKFGIISSFTFFKPLLRKCRAFYGMSFTSEEIDKKISLFEIGDFMFTTTLNIQYGFFIVKLGSSIKCASLLQLLTMKHISYLFSPNRVDVVETDFADKNSAFQEFKAQRDKFQLFYDTDDLLDMKKLVTEIIRFVFEMSITANMRDVMKLQSLNNNIRK